MPDPTDAPSAPVEADPPAAAAPLVVKRTRDRKVLVFAVQVLAILVCAAALGWALHTYLGADQGRSNWILTTLMAGTSLLAGCWSTYRRWRDYTLPLRSLREMLPEARLGSIPIEELSSIKGQLAPIIPHIQQLLRDIREERMMISRLEDETRQRVLSRTDALERKIGSLRQQATRDGLTGLGNRRHLDQSLPQAIELCLATYEDLSVMMIDVDYFKMLNDTLGHAAGDELLRQIAQLIRSTIREADTAFRCGGDEFVVVLPNTTRDVAEQMGMRLRSLIDSLSKTIKVSRPPRLSIGVASLFQTGTRTAHDLLVAADKALYDVKSARPLPSRVA